MVAKTKQLTENNLLKMWVHATIVQIYQPCVQGTTFREYGENLGSIKSQSQHDQDRLTIHVFCKVSNIINLSLMFSRFSNNIATEDAILAPLHSHHHAEPSHMIDVYWLLLLSYFVQCCVKLNYVINCLRQSWNSYYHSAHTVWSV